jgi:hypothetical protein
VLTRFDLSIKSLLLLELQISFEQGPGLIYSAHLTSRPPMSSGNGTLPLNCLVITQDAESREVPRPILALELYEVPGGDDNGKRLRS